MNKNIIDSMATRKGQRAPTTPSETKVARTMAEAVRAHQSGRLDEAENLYGRVLETSPNNAAAYHYLGLIARENNRYEEAVQYLERAVILRPEDGHAHYNLALTYQEIGRLTDAVNHYEETIRLLPSFERTYNNLGVALQDLGRYDEAIGHFATAIRLNPANPDALYNLAYSKRFSKAPQEVTALNDILNGAEITQTEAAKCNFALGKIYDDVGEYDLAFEHYQKGNKLRATQYDREGLNTLVEQLINVCDALFFAQRTAYGSPSELPVFVVGMPRSGTTLVEQILSSHPAVAGAGELEDFNLIANTIAPLTKTQKSYPECIEALPEDVVAFLADDYLEHLRSFSETASRVVDKTPLNFFHLNLIALLFPKARIIHCRRDPLDTCISCYFQNFSEEHPFTNDLGDLGFFYRQYQRLMAHWHANLPVSILDVSYEQLVNQDEAVIREILQFCGLAWDERCLRFYNNDRPIKTASHLQVRQPIYKSSIQRWRHYEKFLQPLREALGPSG